MPPGLMDPKFLNSTSNCAIINVVLFNYGRQKIFIRGKEWMQNTEFNDQRLKSIQLAQ